MDICIAIKVGSTETKRILFLVLDLIFGNFVGRAVQVITITRRGRRDERPSGGDDGNSGSRRG